VQLVEPRRQFQVALKLEGGVLADWMVWREKHAEPKTFVHCRNSFFYVASRSGDLKRSLEAISL
jgi:hypothetical protein